ncbi:MAG: 4-hydroxythreonine-4-phosphate dehydrogenase PdxA [Chitinophagaceae bacterium]
MHHKPIIGITSGDLNGVGIELVIKSFTDHKLMEYFTPVLFCSNKVLNFYKNLLKENQFQYFGTKEFSNLNSKQLNVFNCWDEDVAITPGELNDIGGKYAVRSLEVATQCLKDGQIHGLVTNPLHKKNVQQGGFNYTGHTPFLKDKFAVQDVAMMLCSDNLRVALLTEHVPIADISKHITIDAIVSKTRLIHNSLIKDFGIDKPKIAVLGLNPHAGDEGLVGEEEKTIIGPAIEKLKNENILAFGPYSSDGFFARQHDKQFDCVLAMYHDQGLIPFKSFDNGMGVNYTAGLPVVRTSPDHGTAFDIAGKNLVDKSSFLHSLFLCVDVLNQRMGYAEAIKNKLKKGISKSIKKSKEDIEE